MLNLHIREKAFHGNTVIADLNIAAVQGEIVALVGPSGAGKSTLLQMIAGLDTAFDGTIHINSDAKHSVGIMFQEARLMPWLTVLDNVMLVADTDTPDTRRHAEALLTQVGIGHAIHAYPGQLSGGMAKRVALARAFMYNPALLLMDEPFSSLDAPAAEGLRQLLLSLHQQTTSTILYVTHDLKEAVCIADRILLLSESPMTVLHDVPVTLPRPRHVFADNVTQTSQSLYARFGALLQHPAAVGQVVKT